MSIFCKETNLKLKNFYFEEVQSRYNKKVQDKKIVNKMLYSSLRISYMNPTQNRGYHKLFVPFIAV